MMNRRSFTLVELLVVVSIIALLIAILLPSLKKARDVAKTAVCMSNMHGLAVAVYQYATANNGRLVTAGLAHGGSVNEHAAWINTLQADLGNKLLVRCPADQSPHWTEPVSGTDQLRRASYGVNYWTVTAIAGRGPYDRIEVFKSPSSTVHMAELTDEGQFAASDHVHPESWFLSPRKLAGEELAYERHLRKANYSFIDSHVETLAFEATYAIGGIEAGTGGVSIIWKHNLYDPIVAH